MFLFLFSSFVYYYVFFNLLKFCYFGFYLVIGIRDFEMFYFFNLLIIFFYFGGFSLNVFFIKIFF